MLEEKLNRLGIRKKDLAAALGVCDASVTNWFNGLRTPRRDSLLKIKELTNGEITANDFVNLPIKRRPKKSTNLNILQKIQSYNALS